LEYAIIKSIEIATNDDESVDTRMLTVEASDGDVFDVELSVSRGTDVAPSVGDRVYYDSMSETYQLVSVLEDPTGVNKDLKEGERESYSVSGGQRKATITYRQDGSIELNKGTDFAVKFNELKKEFDALAKAFNAFLSHTHITDATVLVGKVGTIAPAVAPQQYTGNLDKAKVDKVKL